QPLARLEGVRIVAPLAILGFMSSRIPYANDWLTADGFRVPDLGTGPHQPIYLPALLPPAAWALVAILVGSGLALSAGFGTGIAEAKGAWLAHDDVVWSHLHDSYQTWITYQLALHVPGPVWTCFQGATLAFEVGAPLWFALPWTRKPALFVGLGMHAFIGLCF